MREKRAAGPVDGSADAITRASDDQLLALAATGNTRAFEAIVLRYRPALIRFCGSLTRPERVDDAVQQAFVSAWLAIDQGVLVRDLRPWLYTIARNAAVDQHRARTDHDELPLDLVGGGDPAAIAAGRTYFEAVLQAVSDLPERQRLALVETAVHGRSTDAVASDLGVSGGALRQLVHRARVTVRTAVTSLGSGPLFGWLSQLGADDGARRLATALGGAGQGTLAAVSRTTAAVVSAGAIAAGGLTATDDHRAATRQLAEVTPRAAGSGGGGSSGAASAATAPSSAAPSNSATSSNSAAAQRSGTGQSAAAPVPLPARAADSSATAATETPAGDRSAGASSDGPADRGTSGADERRSSSDASSGSSGEGTHDSSSAIPARNVQHPGRGRDGSASTTSAAVGQPVTSSLRTGRPCDTDDGGGSAGTAPTSTDTANAARAPSATVQPESAPTPAVSAEAAPEPAATPVASSETEQSASADPTGEGAAPA